MTVVPLLRNEELTSKGKEGQDYNTEYNTVPAKDLKAVLADIAHEESDSKNAHNERYNDANGKDAPFG